MRAGFVRLLCSFALCLGFAGPALQARAQEQVKSVAARTPRGVSPAGMLNIDGTLHLTPESGGAIDLTGWNVSLDPLRGPVFDAAGKDEADTTAAPGLDEWGALGDGAGAVDGYVRAIVVSGTDIYVGGDFTDVANLGTADYVAKWDGSTWSALGSDGNGNGSINNTVYALALSGSTLYVGGSFSGARDGSFSLVAGTAYVARWDGAHWAGLGGNGAGGSSLNSGVTALAATGSIVYVAGYFTDVNNGGVTLTAADYVARWDGTNWSSLSSNGAGQGSIGSNPYALALIGTTLYVGGYFTNVNDNGVVLNAADYIAQWDGSHWSALSSNGAGNGSISGGFVWTMAVSGSTLYVGGLFQDVNDGGNVIGAADYLARWDGTHWSAVGSNGAGNGALNSIVYAIWVNGADVYAGGSFTDVNNNGAVLGAADYVAHWDGSNWSAIGTNGAGNGSIPATGAHIVMAIAQASGQVFVGGGFFDLSDGGATLLQADFLAAWNGSHWSALGDEPNGALVNGYASSAVYAILVNGTDVYVGGYFENVSNHGVNLPAADYVAKWDGTNWSALGSDGAGEGSLRGRVTSLAWISPYLYVSGNFVNVNDAGVVLGAADHIARWNGTHWSALGSNGAGDGVIATNQYVNVLAASGSMLYVGGTFTDLNNNGVILNAADRIARWDGTSWSALGSNGAGDGSIGNGWVGALAVNGSTLYVGGGFTDVNDGGSTLNTADYIATWDGTHWSAVGDNGAGDGALNDSVSAIATDGATVYAGGAFTDVNDQGTPLTNADYFAMWNGSHWSAVGSGASAFNSSVNAIAVVGTKVYVGGNFTNVRNGGVSQTAADYVARWDGTDWTALGTNGQVVGSLSNLVYALGVRGTDLLVGGYFTNVLNGGTDMVKQADYLATYGLQAATPAPVVDSILRGNINPIGGDIVQYGVQFTKSVTGVDAADFAITTTGLTGSSINSVSGSGTAYIVMVNVGVGSAGTLRLDLIDNDTIVDGLSQPLGGVGVGNGDFTTGQVYTIDRGYPVVNSITRVDPNPTRSDVVQFLVTFSRAVSPVAVNDFEVTSNGLTGATVTGVIGSGTGYTVTVTTGSGSGTLRLDLIDNDTIRDNPFNPLGGPGYLNGNFSAGETYDVRNRWVYLPLLRR